MPIPVPIPGGTLAVTAAENARVEDFVARLAQVLKYGTSGLLVSGKPAADRLTVPLGDDPTVLVPLELDEEKEQLWFRQHAFAIVQALAPFATSTVIGITRLSSDPANPAFPTALNSEETSVVPTPNKIPRAGPAGTIDPGWVGAGPGPGPFIDSVFTGVCVAGDAVGDLMYMTGAGKTVAKVDPTNNAKMPAIGCIISKSSATSCVIQTNDLVSSVYTGLTPGKMYFAGTNSKPTLTRPTPGVGLTLLVQPVGFAIDTNLFLMTPGTAIARIRG